MRIKSQAHRSDQFCYHARRLGTRSGLLLDSVEIQTGPQPSASIIWLHGLGADGHDFEPIVPELSGISSPLRYIFPHAPVRPVTVNGGLPMRAWYDVPSLTREQEDGDGIRASAAQIEALIDRELARGVAAERILLAGFSQGGAMALYVGLRYPKTLAGIIGLLTYLPLADQLADERSDANLAIPLFLAHGSADPVLPVALGEQSQQRLEALSYSVEWHRYPGLPHAVSPQEIRDLERWMVTVLDNA